MNRVQSIYVIDQIGNEDERCSCGERSMFVLGFNEIKTHICEGCIAELAKRIIDGLR